LHIWDIEIPLPPGDNPGYVVRKKGENALLGLLRSLQRFSELLFPSSDFFNYFLYQMGKFWFGGSTHFKKFLDTNRF